MLRLKLIPVKMKWAPGDIYVQLGHCWVISVSDNGLAKLLAEPMLIYCEGTNLAPLESKLKKSLLRKLD